MPEKTMSTEGFTAPPGRAAPARHVVDAVGRLCSAAGGSLDDVVHMNVLAGDAAAIEPVLGVFRNTFPAGLPARLAATFAAAPLPGVAVTIQATARLGEVGARAHPGRTRILVRRAGVPERRVCLRLGPDGARL